MQITIYKKDQTMKIQQHTLAVYKGNGWSEKAPRSEPKAKPVGKTKK